MKKELEELGFTMPSPNIMYWKGDGNESIAMAYIGDGKYNISVYDWTSSWDFHFELPKDKVILTVRDYFQRRNARS